MSSFLAPAPRRRRKPKLVPRPTRLIHPRMVEARYRAEILRLLEPARELVERLVVPEVARYVVEAGGARLDDYAEDVGRVFGGIRVEYERIVTEGDLEGTARRAAAGINDSNRRQVDNQLKSVLGLDLFKSEPWLPDAAQGFVRDNVRLIKSIPERYFAEVEQLIIRNVRAGMRAEVHDEIAQRYGVSRSRAALIADDQTGKFFGRLTRRRHTDVGLKRYRWRTVRDERVRGRPDGKYPRARPSHWHREGKIYSYDDPPEGGHPGEAIRCRCYCEPVFEDLLGGEFAVDNTLAPASVGAIAVRAQERRGRKKGKTSPLRDGMTLAEAENAIRKKKFEHIGAFDSSGRLLHTGVGSTNSVDVPRPLLLEMRRRRDVLLTHNHPMGSPLSPQDVAIAITGNAREIRATVPSGGAWSMKRPPEGWRTRMQPDRLVSGLQGAYKRGHDAALKVVAARLADRRSRTAAQVERFYRRALGEEVVREYNTWSAAHGYAWRLERER